jgi:hypothetical protein
LVIRELTSVHYRVFDDNGEATSKTSFDETDTALGRIDVLSIPPPYSVASLKRRLVIAEEITDHNSQLFEDEDSRTAMNDGDAIALCTKSYPGITEDEPIAIVYNVVTVSSPPQSASSIKRLKAIGRSGGWQCLPFFLSHTHVFFVRLGTHVPHVQMALLRDWGYFPDRRSFVD